MNPIAKSMQFNFENYSVAPIAIKDAWRICDFVVSNTERLKSDFPRTVKANLTPTLAEIFVAKKVKEFEKDLEYLFTIKENTNRTIIGLVYLKELKKIEGQGELAYCVGYRYEGKGITSTATARIAKWAFEELRLRTLQIIVHKSNLASIGIAKNLGFRYQRGLNNYHQKFNGEVVAMDLYEKNIPVSRF